MDDLGTKLPDGREFSFWDCETEFTKTYYVSKAANASNLNPGSKEAPFATIGRAATLLLPGERVLIGGGTYDEFVQPARGGESPAKMISYEAAPGERVIITGARPYANGWKKPEHWAIGGGCKGAYPVYEGSFNHGDFERVNPFSMVNQSSHPWESDFYIANAPKAMDWGPYLMRRGLLFCDGEALTQINSPRGLAGRPGTYWVEDSGFVFMLHLKDGSNPNDHLITYTCREQLFSPSEAGTGYIRVSGLEFECVGNGVPGTQKGMVSTHIGHHWIIENNKVRWANSIGIDVGRESTVRDAQGLPSGGMIVRGNRVSYCGICGITGLSGNEGLLVEGNFLTGNCWHDFLFNWESAAIKVHSVKNGLIRLNTITDTVYGDGIWTDWSNENERICYNFIFNTQKCSGGGIFIEASDVLNRADHNVIVGCRPYSFRKKPDEKWGGGNGIICQDSSEVLLDNNIILDAFGAALNMLTGSPDRMMFGHGALGIRHRLAQNIIAKCGVAMVFSNAENFADGDVVDEGSLGKPYTVSIEPHGTAPRRLDLRSAHKYQGWEENGRSVSISYECDMEAKILRLEITYMGETMAKEIEIGRFFDLDDVRAFLGNAGCK